MNIGIVTVYDGVSNLGSYLQAYAMQYKLKELGHTVYFLEKESVFKRIWQHIAKLNPKRAFFLRLHSGWNYLLASRQFNFVKPEATEQKLDCLLFGSDEIWNMDNPYFKDRLFWGTEFNKIPKIAYAASVGTMTKQTLSENFPIAEGILSFHRILVRDNHTATMIGDLLNKDLPLVCDPTFLVGKDTLQIPVALPKRPYILVYSYGLDANMIKNIQHFAKEKHLDIISAHFWHHFCDRTICCKPLEFSTLMGGADYVFTSTFHGAVFAMMNHTKCCILPVRDKVRAVVEQMGQAHRLVAENVGYEEFKTIIQTPFDTAQFESTLTTYRKESIGQLEAALKCLE